MTRFQIVGIFEDKILTAGEFNGDGYFEGGHGEELCAQFPNIKTEEDYRKMVKDMNDQYFKYEEGLINQVENSEDLNFYKLKQKHRYFIDWSSDYLYIINLSDKNRKIIDENHISITLKPGGWVTIYFGTIYNQDDPDYKIKCRNHCEIDYFDWFEKICEEWGWTTNKSETEIELTKHSPAGEDLYLVINTNDDLERQVREYAYDFDIDEHVKMWINSSCSGVPCVKDLLEDAEWIKNDLQNLARALIR